MLHVLKFTRYEEVHSEFTVEMKLEAEFEGEILNGFSPTIAQSKAVDSVLDKHFRVMVEDVIDQALRIALERSLLNINLSGMTLQDKISMLYMRQTVGFTNDVYKACRNVEVLLLGIW